MIINMVEFVTRCNVMPQILQMSLHGNTQKKSSQWQNMHCTKSLEVSATTHTSILMSTAWAARSGYSFAIALSTREEISRVAEEAWQQDLTQLIDVEQLLQEHVQA
jgi:hypothetical protein